MAMYKRGVCSSRKKQKRGGERGMDEVAILDIEVGMVQFS